jgi:hypothetical protein
MSDLDYRGSYVTGFIDYQQMRELVHDCPPLDGAVFYNCVIQYPQEDIEQFFEDRQKVYDISEYGYISVYENELSLDDLYKIPASERGTVTVASCDIIGDSIISTTDLKKLYPINFKSCTFEKLDIRKTASRMDEVVALLGGSDNLFQNCTFNLKGCRLFEKREDSTFENCTFDSIQLRIEIPYPYLDFTVFNSSNLKNCTFYRLQFIRLIGNSKQYNGFSPFFNPTDMSELDALNVQISEERIGWSRYARDSRYLKSKMQKCIKSRFKSCDLNILMPIYIEGESKSVSFQTKTLRIPSSLSLFIDNSNLNAHANDSIFTTSRSPNNILARGRKYKTLEDFLLNHKDNSRPHMFESYTGYPKVFAEIANSITFSFWQRMITNLTIGGCKDTLPTQTYQFLDSVFKIINFDIRYINLSMTHDLDYADPKNITRIENSVFTNCRISFIGIKLELGIVFNRCTFEDPLNIGDFNLLYHGGFQEEHRIIFKNCDLRNTLLFRGRPPYAIDAKVGSPYVAIRDRFVVFEDCQIDDTTLIDVENFDFKSGETTMTKRKVLDILKEEPRERSY